MFRNSLCLTVFLVLIGCTLPIQAQQGPDSTTTCSYNFTSGTGNSYLSYCVTANGNILQIQTPVGHPQSGPNGEGYGICNESPAQNYTDYAISDTGNWNLPTLVSHTTSSVKIARTTSDGHWTLTQTITRVAPTSSITIVMALKNNQPVNKVAYLVRYGDVNSNGVIGFTNSFGATLNSAFAWSWAGVAAPPYFGLQLQNVGQPPFGFWQAYVVSTNSGGPNACAFSANDAGPGGLLDIPGLVIAYVGLVPAGQTKTVTLTYRGL